VSFTEGCPLTRLCHGFEILTAASVHLYYDLTEIQPDDKRHFLGQTVLRAAACQQTLSIRKRLSVSGQHSVTVQVYTCSLSAQRPGLKSRTSPLAFSMSSGVSWHFFRLLLFFINYFISGHLLQPT